MKPLSYLSKILVMLCMLVHLAAQSSIDGHTTLKKPAPLAEFLLQDHDGNDFDQTHFKGSWSMIFVGFTTCPDVCPTTLSNLEAVRADMGLRMRPDNIPRIIFLAVDPDRDKPFLKDYLSYFHPQYLGITGSHKELDKLIKSIGGFYRIDKKYPTQIDYDVLHTAFVAIINPKGEMVAKINPPFQAHKTAEYLNNLIRGVVFDD